MGRPALPVTTLGVTRNTQLRRVVDSGPLVAHLTLVANPVGSRLSEGDGVLAGAHLFALSDA